MAEELQTFTFEGHYHESDGGNRCDIVRAYDRDQALALAAIELIDGNGWDRERYESGGELTVKSLADLYEDEVHIDAEWNDLKGTACPNCTSHGGRDTSIEHGAGTIHECRSCGFQWVPLGHKINPSQQTSEQIDAEIAEFWAEFTKEEEDAEV